MAYNQYSNEERTLKFVMVGDAAVGKTCIRERLIRNKFKENYAVTTLYDRSYKRITLPGDLKVSIQLGDIGTEYLTRAMYDRYFQGAHAILFVYDITNYESFTILGAWLGTVCEVFEAECLLPHIALIGNKGDLEHSRIVTLDNHLQFALTNRMSSHSVSAKTGESVELCFQKITAEILGIRLSRFGQSSHPTC